MSASCVCAGELHVTDQAYAAEQDDEISLELGETIEVIHKLLDGWWVVRYEKQRIKRKTIGVTQTHQHAVNVYHDVMLIISVKYLEFVCSVIMLKLK